MKILISIIFVSFIFAVLMFFVILGIILKLIGISEETIFIFLIPVGLLIFIATSLFIKSFTSLWKMDIWLWWIKKIDGLKMIEEKQETEKISVHALQKSQSTVLQKEDA